MVNNKLICIVGATASGKTSLGVELAKKYNGEIVSADSRQIFRGLDIGTGKEGNPSEAREFLISKSEYLTKPQKSNLKNQIKIIENCSINNSLKIENCKIENLKQHCRFIDGIPQWLIDICEPEEKFSMFDWLELAKIVLDDIWKRGKLPIVVGGTGLYVQALIEGFTINNTEKHKNIKTKVLLSREKLEKMTREQLQETLKKLDKEAYLSIDLNNPVRVIRAIEKSQSGEKASKKPPVFDYTLVGRQIPRGELYEKIDRRVDEWFESGFYEEVKGLLKAGVSLDWLNKIGLEYRILASFVTQKLKLKTQNGKEFEQMKQEMKWKIHQYARRQLIWWRRFDVKWASDAKEVSSIAEEFLNG